MPEPWGRGVTLFSLELSGRAASRERALGGDTPTATPKPKDTDYLRPMPARGSRRAAPSQERPPTHMPQRRDSKGPLSSPCSVSLCGGPQPSMTGTEGPHRGVGGPQKAISAILLPPGSKDPKPVGSPWGSRPDLGAPPLTHRASLLQAGWRGTGRAAASLILGTEVPTPQTTAAKWASASD